MTTDRPASRFSSTGFSAPLAAALLTTVFAAGAALASSLLPEDEAPVAPVTVTTSPSALAHAPAYSVFVDEETRFAFIRLESGKWVFARQLDADQLSQLDPTTFVARRQGTLEPVASSAPIGTARR